MIFQRIFQAFHLDFAALADAFCLPVPVGIGREERFGVGFAADGVALPVDGAAWPGAAGLRAPR
jgi:hypothetical protein